MTARQLAWHREISTYVPLLVADARELLRGRPNGWLVRCRVPAKYPGPMTGHTVLVMKTKDGLMYRRDELHARSKGVTDPPFRPLAPLEPRFS